MLSFLINAFVFLIGAVTVTIGVKTHTGFGIFIGIIYMALAIVGFLKSHE